MTYEEAIENLMHCEIWHGNEWDDETKHVIAKTIELLEKQAINEKTSDKYKWHDLRKDQNDVPEYYEMVCCALQYADGDILTTAKEYHGNSNTFGGYHIIGYYDSGVMTEVIAWREIEPFEELE